MTWRILKYEYFNVTGFSIPDYLSDFNDFFSNESDNSYSLVENVASWFMPAPIATAMGVLGTIRTIRTFQTYRVTTQGEPTTSPALLGGLALVRILALPFILGRVSWANNTVVDALESTLKKDGLASRLRRGITEKVEGRLAQRAARLVVTGKSGGMASLEVRRGLLGRSKTYIAHRLENGIMFTHGGVDTPPVSLREAKRLEEAVRAQLTGKGYGGLVITRRTDQHLILRPFGEKENAVAQFWQDLGFH